MSFIDILAVASTGLAVLATAVSVSIRAKSARQTTRAERTVREVDLKAAIDAVDRPALRRALYEELGSVRVSDYISNQSVRDRFDVLIAEVAQFVAQPAEEPERPPDGFGSAPLQPGASIPTDLAQAYDALLTDDSWAALARLRRALEVRFSSMLGRDEVGVRQPRGAGSQLRQLRRLGRIDEGWGPQLGYAISVCNAAVHGEDVPPSQAAEVLDIVVRWMEASGN